MNKHDNKMAEMYHHLTAKLQYLCKRARPELQTAISFLMTWVTQPDEDDWKNSDNVSDTFTDQKIFS